VKPRRILGTTLSVGALALCSVAAGDAAPPAAAPQWPTHRCGSFTHREHGADATTDRVAVLNRGVSCHTATGVIKAFWSGHGVIQHGGPSDAHSYWTLVAWPGWRCGQGAGAGSCTRGKAIAAYEVRTA
jgi:hypothetical protein